MMLIWTKRREYVKKMAKVNIKTLKLLEVHLTASETKGDAVPIYVTAQE